MASRLTRLDADAEPAGIRDISGSFVSAPSQIGAGSTFAVDVSNDGNEGLNLDIRAELASTAGRFEISELVARFVGPGESVTHDFIISSAEMEGVPDGTFDLEIIAEATFEGGSILLTSAPVTVGGGGDGGDGGGGNGGNGDTGDAVIVPENCRLTPQDGSVVFPDQTIEVRVDVVNDSNASGSGSATVTVNGQTIDTVQFSDVSPYQLLTETVTFTPRELGFSNGDSMTIQLATSGSPASVTCGSLEVILEDEPPDGGNGGNGGGGDGGDGGGNGGGDGGGDGGGNGGGDGGGGGVGGFSQREVLLGGAALVGVGGAALLALNQGSGRRGQTRPPRRTGSRNRRTRTRN